MAARQTGVDAAMRAAALAGIRSGKPMREIALGLYDAERGAAGRHRDGGMRTKGRWPVHRVRAASGAGPGNVGPGTP